MLMAILLVYTTSGITPGKKVCCDLKMAAILKILKYEGGLKVGPLYSCLGEARSGSKWQGPYMGIS